MVQMGIVVKFDYDKSVLFTFGALFKQSSLPIERDAIEQRAFGLY